MDKRLVPTVFLIVLAFSEALPQRGPPPHYTHGRGPPPSSYSHFGPPKVSHHSKPSGPGPNGPTKMLNWLGSQMAKLPGFNRGPPPPPRGGQSYKPHYPPPSQSYSSSPSVIFPRPPLNSISTADPSIKVYGAPYYTSSATSPSVANAYFSPSQTAENTIYQIISPDGSSRYQRNPPPGYENFYGQQNVVQSALQTPSYSAPPPPPPSTSQLAQHSYQQQQVYQQYPGQFRTTQSSGNMEILPSKMVSYEKETISTGHPDYNAAVDGMATAGSSYSPVAYTQAPPQFSDYYGQQVQRVDDNLGTLFQGVAPQVAPIYDLSQSDLSNSASQPAPQVSIDGLLDQGQDMQGGYSHQSAVSVVAPPAGFNYQPNQAVSASEAQQQVKILNHGAQDGNPTFEIFADANAPTYDGGHPFDINQLISMIEPGAKVESGDIVKEAESQGQQTYLPIPHQGIKKAPFSTNSNSDMTKIDYYNKNSNGQSTRFTFPTKPTPAMSKFSFPENPTLINKTLNPPATVQKPQVLFKPIDNNDGELTFNFQNKVLLPQRGNYVTTDPDVDNYASTTSTPTDVSKPNPKTKIKANNNNKSKIIYHSVKQSVNFVNSNKDSNLNYNNETQKGSVTVTPSPNNNTLVQKVPWNPLFDSVEKKIIFRNRGLIHKDDDQEGDNIDAEESRQVDAYAITVTPPAHMFKGVEDESSTTPLSSSVTGPMDMILNTSLATRKVINQKMFPVYRREKSDSTNVSH